MSLNTILATAPLTTTNYILKATGTTIGNSLIFDNGTNVGIGNTNTSYTLDVSGTLRTTSDVVLGGGSTIFGTTGSKFYIYPAFSTNLNLLQNYNGSAYTTEEHRASDYSYKIGTTAAMTITSSGNVGIGTSSPKGRFDVFRAAGDSGTAAIVISSGESPSRNWSLNTDVITDGDFAICVSTTTGGTPSPSAGNTKFYITKGGQVGIGDNSPAIKLLVKSDGTSSAGFGIKINDSSNANLFFARNDGNINTGTAAVSPYNYSTSGRSLVSNSAGDIGYTSSTRESKNNIESITDISWVNQLRPVSFNYRIKDSLKNEFTDETYDDKSYGFIADEVEKVNPDFVFYDIKEDGTQKLAGVKYESMTAILIKAIQELSKQNEELSNRLIKLESK
jgi:hypothetical protein